MNSTTAGVRKTEEYVYQSLHWAFPMVPLLVVSHTILNPSITSIALFVTALVASASGLAVLHTRLRDADLLPASRWDRFRTTNLGAVEAVWAVTSAAAAVLQSTSIGRDLFITVAVPAFLGGVLALPLLVRGVSLIVTGIAAILLSEVALWGWAYFQPRDADGTIVRITATYWTGFLAAMIVGFAAMFLNVLRTTRDLERARVDGAKLAVAEERLRFSRDLHDVFGRTLSAVALKAELAAAQAERGRPEAAETMREVQSIAVNAQEEVRAVVRGYREADLTAEIAGARAVLESAGITVTTEVEGVGALPAPVARTFAWVVREAVTNILRHADATTARVAVTRDAEGARLVVANDRPHPASGTPGSGLLGLRERVTEVGGTLDARPTTDAFTLTVTVAADSLTHLAQATADTQEETA